MNTSSLSARPFPRLDLKFTRIDFDMTLLVYNVPTRDFLLSPGGLLVKTKHPLWIMRTKKKDFSNCTTKSFENEFQRSKTSRIPV